ncbi:HNH endonuclease [Seohaeicola zhoushanensis]
MPLQARWRAVHLIHWEERNGPLPKGYALKCLDGDKLNTDPANWEAIRALLPRLNGRFGRNYDTAPAELKPTIMTITKLEHRARELRQQERKEDAT